MTIWEALGYVLVFGVIMWWAWTADFSSCNDCDQDCNQGRNCKKDRP